MKSVSALLPGERVDSNRVQRSSTSSPDSVGLEMIVQVGGGGVKAVGRLAKEKVFHSVVTSLTHNLECWVLAGENHSILTHPGLVDCAMTF